MPLANDPEARPRRPAPLLRWLAWLAYGLAWTAALLTRAPVQLGARVLSAPVFFSCAKMLHVAAYAGWAVLTAWLPLPPWLRRLLLLVLAAHAPGSEYGQRFVPGRHPSWRDVGLDLLGIVLGILATRRLWRVVRACPRQDEAARRKAG